MRIFRKIRWTVWFIYADLFRRSTQPQYGLTRWQLFKKDFKFIWNIGGVL